jgi:hypothetical protein
MAAGPVTLLDIAIEKIGNGEFNLSSDSFKIALCEKDEALTAAFVGTSGDARYSDLSFEITGGGYTAGGEALANTQWTRTGSTTLFSADPTAWEALDNTMKYGVIYRDSGDNEIVAFFDLELDNPDGRVSGGGDFVITYSSGLFDATRGS